MSRYNYVRDFFHYLYCPFNRNSEKEKESGTRA